MDYKEFDINFGLEGKVAVITGGLSGIGEATAELFIKKGAKIAIFDVQADAKEKANDKFGDNAIGVTVDVTKKEQIESAIEETLAKYGKIDLLVNSAGVALLDDAENLSEEYWDKTFAINVKGSFLVAQAIGKQMIKSGGGKIINLASQASVVALDNHVAYCASKGAIVSMTQVLAYEWAQYNINVNCISPTVILTELGKKAWAGQVGEDMKKQIPAGRFGYPEEVAACALFLAADASNLMTGENMIIDGGYTIK
ncbi:SDR family oxidoreductase [Vagococcus xieshaowenii]|uniref:D-threitol dehydrogenase n=1 Tax=Vagococcus xieshaowenii TaxID=2562451 RepID=A0AAJ5EER0_9ENTE|nr:D-threitol dehydrogenase [Vagococcus xieshaowenii]QCA29429.1 D-threitol dehydrogenase [Vagococcus xieshaowenii]TFZ41549.1 D-threitol dehydrogenase [Vagococcus xieshaowenii]